MRSVTPRVEASAAKVLAGLSRRDQRARGELYLRGLLQLAKMRWRIEGNHRELTDGLDHFEGRSMPGRHRHVTLASLAQAICTQLRYAPKPPAPACPSTPSPANSQSPWPSGPTPAPPATTPSQAARNPLTSNDYRLNKSLLDAVRLTPTVE